MFESPQFDNNSLDASINLPLNNSLDPLQKNGTEFSSQQLMDSVDETVINDWENQGVNPAESILDIVDTVNQAIDSVKASLTQLTDNPQKNEIIKLSFGVNDSDSVADELLNRFKQQDFTNTPNIELISSQSFNGAYARENNTIYLSQEFIVENLDNISAIQGVLLEELGHYLDAQINVEDAAGDEGDIFSRLVRGDDLSAEELALLKEEDDNGFIFVDETKLAIEKNIAFRAQELVKSDEVKGDYTNLITGDFNGDGRDDFIRQEKGYWDNDNAGTAHILLSYGNGYFSRQDLTDAWQMKGDLTNLIVGDFNGDGKDDFIRQEKGVWDDDEINTANVYFSYGNGSFWKRNIQDGGLGYKVMQGDLTNLIVGDFNGDGRDDFIRQEKGYWDDDDTGTAHILLSHGNGYFSSQDLTDAWHMKGDLTNLIVGDFNGDGKDDFIRQEKGYWDDDETNTANVYFSYGDGSFWKRDIQDGGLGHKVMKGDLTNLIVGDFNGDGRDDFIRQEKGYWDNDNAGTAHILLSHGNGNFWSRELTDSWQMKGDLTNLIVGDFNGDGRDDFIRQEKWYWDNDISNTANVYISNGNGTFIKQELTDYAAMKGDYTNLIIGDYNGDGRDDFIRQEKSVWDNDNTNTANLYLSNDSRRLVREIYQNTLGENPNWSNYKTYLNHFNNGSNYETVRSLIANSYEARNKVNTAYRTILQRNADPGGLQYYLGRLAQGLSLQQVYESISSSYEARNNFWVAQYFNNTNRIGNPVFAESLGRNRTGFQRNWGYGSPSSWVSKDNFSARINGKISLGAGTHEISVNSDDGVRVRVNGQIVINRLVDQPFSLHKGTFNAGNGGKFNVEIDYYERGGAAALNFATKPLKTIPNVSRWNWKAEFFNNRNHIGDPVAVQDWGSGRGNFSKNWGYGSPVAGVNGDNFSTRLTTRRYFSAGHHQIQTTADDGIKVSINNSTIIDNESQASVKHTRLFDAGRGGYFDVVVDYKEYYGAANLKFDVIKGNPYKGTISGKDYSGQLKQHSISIDRVDGNYSKSVSANKKTWLVIHGMNNDPNSDDVNLLAKAIDKIDPNDQVFALDWSKAAFSDSKLSITNPFNGTKYSIPNPNFGGAWITRAAEWAAKKLTSWGISGSTNINLVGHSLGAYVSAEIAKNISGGVDKLLAFDPASRTAGLGGYDSESVNFSAHSKYSWAFYTSGFGNSGRATTADDAFTIGFDSNSMGIRDNHGNGLDLFASMLERNRNDKVSSWFKLDRMGQRPWKENQFNEYGGFSRFVSLGKYEGRIEAKLVNGRWVPDYLRYKSIHSPWWNRENIMNA